MRVHATPWSACFASLGSVFAWGGLVEFENRMRGRRSRSPQSRVEGPCRECEDFLIGPVRTEIGCLVMGFHEAPRTPQSPGAAILAAMATLRLHVYVFVPRSF